MAGLWGLETTPLLATEIRRTLAVPSHYPDLHRASSPRWSNLLKLCQNKLFLTLKLFSQVCVTVTRRIADIVTTLQSGWAWLVIQQPAFTQPSINPSTTGTYWERKWSYLSLFPRKESDSWEITGKCNMGWLLARTVAQISECARSVEGDSMLTWAWFSVNRTLVKPLYTTHVNMGLEYGGLFCRHV